MADDLNLWETHSGWWQDGFTDGADLGILLSNWG